MKIWVVIYLKCQQIKKEILDCHQISYQFYVNKYKKNIQIVERNEIYTIEQRWYRMVLTGNVTLGKLIAY